MASYLVGVDLFERIAWCLVHSLWQGTVILFSVVCLRLLLPSPRWRCGVSLIALLTMLAAPVLTFVYTGTGNTAAALTFGAATGEPVFVSSGTDVQAVAVPWAMWIVLVWLAGVAVCLLRLLGAWRATRRLLLYGTAPVAPATADLVRRLSTRLRLRVPVRLLRSVHVDSPVVIGCLRPVVLVPAAVFTGLTPAQLEAVLAHELAHIRRHDYLVNVLQSCVESILFYHPAVWWLSGRIRADREECCDDVALENSRDAGTYASALLELEHARSAGSLAMASTGGSLTRRVRRLLGAESCGRDWRDVFAPLALTALLLATAYGANGLRAQPANQQGAEPAPAAEAALPAAARPAESTSRAPSADEDATEMEAERAADAARAAEMARRDAERAAGEARREAERDAGEARRDAERAAVEARMEAARAAEEAREEAARAAETTRIAEARRTPESRTAARSDLSWVLLQGDTVLLTSGSRADVAAARSAHGRLGADLLWFRHPQGAYVIRDPQVLQRVLEIHAPQRELAEQQAALAAAQARLAAQMNDVRVEVDMSGLQDQLAEISEHMPGAATQRELGEMQRALAGLQRELGRLQAEAGREQARIARMQAEHGRRQAELGSEQAETARRLDRETRALLQEAVESGLATLE